MRISEIRQRLREAGALPTHEFRVLRLWSQALPQTSGPRRIEDFLPQALRDALPAIEAQLDGLAHVISAHPGEDGGERLLVGLADGQSVESVLLPRADGLCISSQVGCAVGCVFCMTGRSGLVRQVGSAEMVAQVVLARTRRPVKKVVFMGMGEPAHNLDNVLEAIDLLGTAGNIGHKNLVLSTVGDPRVFERLPQQQVKPALALSLHTTKAQLRARLLPRAPAMTPEEIVERGEAYARATGYPIQYQWTLLEGINDGDDEVEGIVRLLEGKYGVLNLIPYNTVDGLDFKRPPAERAREMLRTLMRRRILTKLRQSAAQDVEGGCGQLRARAMGGGSVQRVEWAGRAARGNLQDVRVDHGGADVAVTE
ncbi:RNA methyltransferase [Ramlibacter albus]|uniref:RNA methyltransferase n=1 Tax=Ramlibacter albus TaxID=2079448 RepID=A0A923MBW2_9BURK|nr:RNA methyltransferase [Ramlibacter albus]MBC5767952.1 RNA methyltransferase [Ramlibacter albus]